MSYNSYHKPGVSSNINRGRGFSSRGSSFRGRGGAENGSASYNSGNYSSGPGWSSTSSRGRGSFPPSSSSRGRPNWYNKDHSSSFDSRKYSSNSPLTPGGSDRYSSRGRGDDSYRRYSRIDGPGYSSRDHGHHRSPEGSRKRVRSEHAFNQQSSSRRSHENNYSGSGEYGSRYSGYNEEKSGSGYGDERGRGGSGAGNSSYREEARRSSGGGSAFRERTRGDDYHGGSHRKGETDSSLPPPSVSGSRGGYRGRLMRGSGRGGISRLMLRRQEILSRKRSDLSFLARKRLMGGMSGRFHSETLRKIKIQKMRRLQRAKEAKEAASENEASDHKEENWDDAEKVVEKEKKEKKAEESEKKSKTSKSSTKEEIEEGEEVEEEEEGEPPKKKKKSESDSHSAARHNSESRNVSTLEAAGGSSRYKPYIKLSCPHCYRRYITFKDYTMHLYSHKHAAAMRKQSFRHKQTLAKMRMAQRAKQRLLDEQEEASGTVSRTHFCHICKLNYRQLKSKHALSDSHRAMKKFLMPFCSICRVSCKSPMSYENHICSLEHIRRKARLEELGDVKRRHSSEERSPEEDDDKDINLENFMTLDSVGVVDETSNPEDETKPETAPTTETKPKAEVNVGAEFVKEITAQYCELCSMYLSRSEKTEKVLAQHCRTRTHLKRYVRSRRDRTLIREAEMLHNKRTAEKEAEAKKKKSESVKRSASDDDNQKENENSAETKSSQPPAKRSAKTESTNKENPTVKTENAGASSGAPDNESATANEGEVDGEDPDTIDDKLWADVDKDLGELLREVEPGNKSSDEDEDSRAGGGRYDRFRLSEKERGNSSAPSSEPDGIDKPANETLESQPEEETAKVEEESKKTTRESNSPSKEEPSKNTE